MGLPPGRARDELTFEFIRPPGRRHTFRSTLLEADAEHIVLAHRAYPSKPLIHAGEEVMAAGYWAVWFLFKGRPFDVGRFYRPDGSWTGYYVDVLEPVRWDGADPHSLVPLVDLFLDIWIAPGGEYLVLDEDELAAAVAAGHLTARQIRHADATLRDLIGQIERGTFPPEIVSGFKRSWP